MGVVKIVKISDILLGLGLGLGLELRLGLGLGYGFEKNNIWRHLLNMLTNIVSVVISLRRFTCKCISAGVTHSDSRHL